MRFLDDYTIVSDIEGDECIFVRSIDGKELTMYVDTPGGIYINTIKTEGILSRKKFEESYYFYGLLKFKRWKNRLKEMYQDGSKKQFPASA